MRIAAFLTAPLLAAMLAPPAAAQVSVTLHLGTPVVITHYSPEVYGPWQTAYTTWTPTTVYYFDGHYYSRPVKGARLVQVYRRQNQYFLPPQDVAWANRGDKRYDYDRKPNDDDYKGAGPPGQGRGRGRGRGHGNQ